MGSRWYQYIILCLFILSETDAVLGQSDNVYLDMSLEELFDVDVMVSASKRPEDLFEAPLSVTIIKQEEILQSGATSIPEALRLAPGLIVRESTPGNFDVHIRGFDAVTTSFMTPLPTNTIMLVMIDNRVVYNYFSGGTFWESLPIGVSDIDRIEVVRGPASALYGPNAAAGVINIITHFAEKPGVSAFANAAIGNDNSKISNLSVGYTNSKVAMGISGNYKTQNRRDELYYAWLDREYLPIEDMSTLMFWGFNPATNEPYRLSESGMNFQFDKELAIDKYGLNSYLSYFFSDDFSVNFSGGFQEALSQKPYYNNFATPLSGYDSKSYYGDLITKYKGLYTQISLQTGKHDNNFFWNAYDFDHLDLLAEYQFHFKNLHVRPGISYRKSDYSGLLIDDEEFGQDVHQKPVNNKIIESTGFSLLADYTLANQWRWIGGFRVDDYSINKTLSVTYEAATTYRLNKNNLLRLVYSKANRAPFMLDSFIGKNVQVLTWLGDYTTGFPVLLKFQANQDTDYLSNHNLELGLRSKINPRLDVDVQVFGALLDDFLVTPVSEFSIDTISTSDGFQLPVIAENLTYDNVDYQNAMQVGLEFSVTYTPIENWKLKFFGVLQQTNTIWDKDQIKNNLKRNIDQVEDILGYDYYTEAQLDSVVEADTRDKPDSTPYFYGGFSLNYNSPSRFNVNINGYYSGSQTFTGVSVEEDYPLHLDPYLSLNAKCSYKLWDNVSAFVSAKNIFGKHREYGFADYIYDTYLVGFEILP